MDEVQEKLKVFYDQQEKAAKELRKNGITKCLI